MRAFLDANVLVAAAWRSDARVQRLWTLTGVELVTSEYALGEARRNLQTEERIARLRGLMTRVDVLPDGGDRHVPGIEALRAKDRPILRAAVACGADVLVTGDVRDFGPWMDREFAGVRVLRPSALLAER